MTMAKDAALAAATVEHVEARIKAERISQEATCHDCGDAPVWQFATANKCRDCHAKGGERDYVELDPDRLVSVLGQDLALRVIRECAREW